MEEEDCVNRNFASEDESTITSYSTICDNDSINDKDDDDSGGNVYNLMNFEDDNSSTISEDYNISTIIEDGNSIAILEHSNSSTIIEDGNSSTIIEDVNSSSIIEDGNSIAILEESNSNTIMEDGNCYMILEDGNSIAIIEDSNSNTIIEDSNSNTIIEDVNSNTIIEDGNSIAIIEESNSSTIIEDVNSSSIIEDGNSIAIIEESNSSTIIEDGNSCTIVEDSNSSTKFFNLDEDPITSNFEENESFYFNGDKSVNAEVIQAIDDNSQNFEIDDNYINLRDYVFDNKTNHNGRVDDLRNKNCDENDDMIKNYAKANDSKGAKLKNRPPDIKNPSNNDDILKKLSIKCEKIKIHPRKVPNNECDKKNSINKKSKSQNHDQQVVDSQKHPDNDGKFTTKLSNKETKSLKRAAVSDICSKKDSTSKSGSKDENSKKIPSKEDNDTQISSKGDADSKISSKKEVGLKIGSKKDVGLKIGSKKDVGLKIGSKKDVGFKIGSKKDVGLKIGSKKDVGFKIGSKKDVGLKIGSKKDVGFKISSKKDTDSKTSSKGDTDSEISTNLESNKKISSKEDDDSQISSKEDVDRKISSKGESNKKVLSKKGTDSQISSKEDGDPKTSSKGDGDNKISSKEDGNRKISSKEDGNCKIISKGDGDNKISSKEDGDPKKSSKGDGDPKTSSKGDGDPKTSSKGDGDPKTSSKGDGDPKTSSKGDGDPKTSSKGDGDPKTSSKGDGDPKTSSKGDGDPKTSSKGDGDPKTSSKEDGNCKISSKGDGNSKISSKGDGNSIISSKGNGNNKISTKKDVRSKFSTKKDVRSKISTKKDVRSKIGLNNDASKKNVSNKEAESKKCQNKALEIEIQAANNAQLQISQTDSSSEEEYDILRIMKNPENPEELIGVFFPLQSYPNYKLPDRYVNKKVKGFNSNQRNINQRKNEGNLNLNPESSGVKSADFGMKKTVERRTEALPKDPKKAKHSVEIVKTPPEESTPPSSKRARSKFHCFRCNLSFSSDLSLDVHKVGIHNMKVKRQDWEHSSEEQSGNASSTTPTDSFLSNETVKTGNQVPDFEQSRHESMTTIPDTDSEKENDIVNVMKSQMIRKENESGKQSPSFSCLEMNFTPKVNASMKERFLSKRNLFNDKVTNENNKSPLQNVTSKNRSNSFESQPEDERNSRINSKRNAKSQELEDSPPNKRCSFESSPEPEIIFECVNPKQENQEPEEAPKKNPFDSTEDLEIVYEHVVKCETSVSNLDSFDNDQLTKKRMNSCKSSNEHEALTSNVSVILEDIVKSGNFSSILKKNGVFHKSVSISDAKKAKISTKSSNKRKTLPSKATIILQDIEKSQNLSSILKRNGVKMSRPNFDLHASSQTSKTLPSHIDHNYVRFIENNSPQPTTSSFEEDIDKSTKSFKDYNVVHSQTVSENVSCNVQNLSEHIEPAILSSSSTESDAEPSHTVVEIQKSSQDITENCEPIGQILLKTREPSKFIQELHNLDKALNEICEQRQAASEDPKSNQASQDLSEKHKQSHDLKDELKSSQTVSKYFSFKKRLHFRHLSEDIEPIQASSSSESYETIQDTSKRPKLIQTASKSQEAISGSSKSLKNKKASTKNQEPNQVLSENLKSNQVLSESLKSNQALSKSHKTIEASSQRQEAIEASSQIQEVIESSSQSHETTGSSFQSCETIAVSSQSCETIAASSQSHKTTVASSQSHEAIEVSSQRHKVIEASSQSHETTGSSSQSHETTGSSSQRHETTESSSQRHETTETSSQSHETIGSLSQSHKAIEVSSQSHETTESSSQRHESMEVLSQSRETIEATFQSQEPNEVLLENDAEPSETVFKKSSQDQIENREPIGQILLKARELELNNCDKTLEDICKPCQTSSKDPKSYHLGENLDHSQAVLKIHKPSHNVSDKHNSSQKSKQTKPITSQNLSSNVEVFPPERNSYQTNNLSHEDILMQNAINASLKRKRIPTVEKPSKMKISSVQTSKNSPKALKVISNCIPQNQNEALKFRFQVIEGCQKFSRGPKSGECPYCRNKVGNTEWDVKSHVLESHRHKCGFCKQLFQTEEEYNQHKYNFHMNQLHECIICDDYFQSIAIYDRHINTIGHKKMELKANKIIRNVIRDTLHIELPPDEFSTPNKPNKLERVAKLNPNITRIPHKNVWIERIKENISKALQNRQDSSCSSERTSSTESRRLSSYSSEGNLSPVSSENFDREDYVRLYFEEFNLSRNFLVKDQEIQDLLKKFEMVTFSNADELDCAVSTEELVPNPSIEDQSSETLSVSLHPSQMSFSSPDNLNQSPNTSQMTQNDDNFEDYLENRGSRFSTQNVINSVPIFNDTIKTPEKVIDANSLQTLNTPVINRSKSPNIIEAFCKSGWDSNYVMHNMAEFNKMWNG